MRKDKGQVLVGVIVFLLVLAVIVPAMVLYVQNEARWSVKQQQNTNAFQLAEAAIDIGYQKVTESTSTWASIQGVMGGAPPPEADGSGWTPGRAGPADRPKVRSVTGRAWDTPRGRR